MDIIEATLNHVQILGSTMNKEDREEIEALGLKAYRSLWRSWKNSIVRKTLIVDGEIGAIWGCSGSIMGMVGQPWLVTAPIIKDMNPHLFARMYRQEARELLQIWPVLQNYVDNSYRGAVKMLRLSGFSFDEPIQIGKLKRMYRRFYRTA